MSAAGEYLPPLVTTIKGDIGDLKRAFAEAKSMMKDYKSDVADMNATLRDSGRDAERTTQAMVGMGAETETAMRRGRQAAHGLSTETDGLNTSLRRTRRDADDAGRAVSDFERLVTSRMRLGQTATAAMREEYGRLKKVVGELREEMRKPYSTHRAGAFGSLTGALGDLRTLERMGAQMGMTLAENAGQSFIRTIGTTIGAGLTALGPVGAIIAGVIIAAIILAAPAIGGAIAASVAVGLGAGVIGLGIMILKDDKGIQKAWERLTKTTSSVFERAAQPMKKPFIEALNFFREGFKDLEPDLKAMFKAAAPLVAPLAGGIFGAIQNMLPGITQAVTNLQPVFTQLGADLPVIGIAIGYFFQQITENGPAVSIVLHDMIFMTAGLIMVMGELLGWLTSVYVDLRNFGRWVREGLSSARTELNTWEAGVKTWARDALKEAGAWLMFGFVDGIVTGWHKMQHVVRDTFRSVTDTVKGVFDSHSPSRVFMSIGRDTVTGFAMGVRQEGPSAWAAWAGLMSPHGTRGTYNSAGAALPLSGGGSMGSASAGRVLVHAILNLDGRRVYEAIIPHAQRDGIRNVTSGMTRVGTVTA